MMFVSNASSAQRPRTVRALTAAFALLAFGTSACGARPQTAKTASSVANSTPSGGTLAEPKSVGDVPDHPVESMCDLSLVLSRTVYALRTREVVVDSAVGEVRLPSGADLVAQGPVFGGDIPIASASPRTSFPISTVGWFPKGTAQLADGDYLVLIGPDVFVKPGVFASAAIAVARLDETGAIAFLDECGETWNAAVNAQAASVGVDVTQLLFDARGTDPNVRTKALAEIDTRFLNIAPYADSWRSQPIETRSISPADLPQSERSRFAFSGLNIAYEPGTYSPGTVELRTADGLAARFQLYSVSGVLPTAFARVGASVTVTFLDQSGKSIDLAVIDSSVFDERLGAELRFAIDGQGLVATVRTLEAGELEKLMGASREEIEAIRQRFVDAPDPTAR